MLLEAAAPVSLVCSQMRKQTLTSTWLEKRTLHTHEYPPGDGVRPGANVNVFAHRFSTLLANLHRNIIPAATSM